MCRKHLQQFEFLKHSNKITVTVIRSQSELTERLLFQAEQRLAEEHKRIELYLNGSTLQRLMKTCETVGLII